MKKSSLVTLAATLAIVGFSAWYLRHGSSDGGGHGAAAPSGQGQQGPTTVSVVGPQRRDVQVMLQANGTVTPIRTVDLHPQTTSTIVRVHIKEGQFVKQGDLMFALDDRSARANVEKAEAQVARDRAALADYERQYRRAEDLLAQKYVAQGAVDTLKSQVEAARALLAADIAAARAVGVDASYNTIRAPMSGRVGAINVYPGSLVQLSTSLTTVTQLDPINVAFTLPESSLASLLDAQQRGPVEVRAALAGAAQSQTGFLSFIDNTVDPVAGVIRVKAEFDNRATTLWPGQYVNAQLVSHTIRDALVIPQNAIISNTHGTFVYAVDADQSAKMVQVRRLHAFGDYAAVSGLAGNEQVIVDGKQNLRPGARVRLVAAEAVTGPASGGASGAAGTGTAAAQKG